MNKKPYIPNHLLGERGRRNRFGYACFKTDGGDDRQELLDTIKQMITEGGKNFLTRQDIDAQVAELQGLPANFLRGLADEKTGILSVLKKQGEEITELKTRGLTQDQRPKSLREQIADWQKANKNAIDLIKSGVKSELTKLEVRAVASPMTPATVDSGASAYIPRPFIEAGVNDIPRRPLTFWDSLRKPSTNSAVYVWVNKTNPQGAAAFIGPGVLKPGVSFELASDLSNAKKIAVSSKAALELLDDIDGMVDMIEGEMRYQLLHELNSKLLFGVASTTVPAGITTLATAYLSTAIKAASPNNLDAIFAVAGYLRSGALTGRIVAYMNPVDAANMVLLKNTQGSYLLPPFATAGTNNYITSIGGVDIIQEAMIPAGSVLIALIDYYYIKIYKDFTVSVGWENDDFTRNLQTWISEMRLHQYFNQQYTGAFIYDTFANIITKIT